MLVTRSGQVSLWEPVLPEQCLGMPEELARVGALLDDPAFFVPFAEHFDPVWGRPSIPMETYLRLMFLKYRYRLSYELLAEVADSISWQRFARVPLGARVPHSTTLMKITTRCGLRTVEALNETLLAKAAGAKLLRTHKVRADTTVVEANVAYPTDSGLLAAVAELETTLARTIQIVTQTRSRLSGVVPHGASRLVSLHDPDARPIRKGRLGRPVEFGYKAQVVDTTG